MDDGSCAVCAETVQWVAYGPCGHKDVCAICIARLRFICNDRHCCICKCLSSSVFVTRALGSLTGVINDFSILPADAKDGKVGSYWFHEDTQAYFDDFDEYKIIKAMCRLSCSVCDKLEAEGIRNSKRRGKFKSIEQLKDHLSRQHDLYFCSLCLEYKKVFLSEQKLFSRAQLRQHISYGDSEVDGNENERCGFSGHPSCKFCQRPFYSDNELYFHMPTEHYTCHICQRQHSTQYEYYKDYNDLENHFREAHFLCEDDTCLAKKFIVFPTDADLKRHNALEHGGSMCRAKCRTALQLNACFHHRGREEEGHHERAQVTLLRASNVHLSSGSSANDESNGSNVLRDVSSVIQSIPGHSVTREFGSSVTNVPSSGQLQGSNLDFRSVLLSGSEFPPLPRSSKKKQRRKSKKKSEEASVNHILMSSSSHYRSSNAAHVSNSSPFISPHIGSLAAGRSTSSDSVNSYNLRTPMSNGIAASSSAKSGTNSTEVVGPSSPASNIISEGSKCLSTSTESTPKGFDIQAANKSLVERIYASLEFDKDKFSAFKIVSKEYREGEIDAGEYLSYVHQFGLAHLISDLARLCPDPQKQKELLEMHKKSLGDISGNVPRKENGKTIASKPSKKGKEKCGDSSSCIVGESWPASIANNFKDLKLNTELQNERSIKVEHPTKGKSKTAAELSPIEDVGHSTAGGSRNSSGVAATGGKKKMKKKSKFLRTRLGESSESADPDLSLCDMGTDLMVFRPDQDSILASVRGVWRNDGGRRLVTMSQVLPSNR